MIYDLSSHIPALRCCPSLLLALFDFLLLISLFFATFLTADAMPISELVCCLKPNTDLMLTSS